MQDVSLSVVAGERLALLGRNGSGKTTLLRVLTGQVIPETGTIWQADGLRLAVLEQHNVYIAGQTVSDLANAMHPYRELEIELLSLEANLGDPQTLSQWTALYHQLQDAEAFSWPARMAKILSMLDLSRFLQREAATLSGGEKTRLALALALAAEPDLLLLDEPTNHLDIRMREWLENWLKNFRGGVILTSHDRDFLDSVSSRSLWLEAGYAEEYAGGYSKAKAQRQLERRSLSKAARLSQQEERRLNGSVEQLELWGRRSKALKTRVAKIVVSEAPLPERQIRMRLLAGTARAQLIVWGEHLSKSYTAKSYPDHNSANLVLSDVAFKLRQGDRVALMGANGTGKTTLMNLLSGDTFADARPTDSVLSDSVLSDSVLPDSVLPDPVLRVANGVTVASLDQVWHGLSPHQGLYAQFERRFGLRAKVLLGRAGFSKADWLKTPEILSGGERARAGLALVSALRADLLLLDEPTNHLDVEALQALEEAIHAYAGVVVIVTHDRRFAREVANRLWVIEAGQLKEVASWGSREYTDPARSMGGDPPPPMPQPTPRQALSSVEQELMQIQAQLNTTPLTGREEARLRSRNHHLQHDLYELYAEAFSSPQFDAQVQEPPLVVQAQRFGEQGGMFWAADNETCPHLAWDGNTLRWSESAPAWFGAALLGGALRILFERWYVVRVYLGEGGPSLSRRQYFERVGIIRLP